ncbi:glyoxalase [Candidatus Poribacteria bacterium]|nr:glyoxalase [Candidatus Poribacteria bacterium]OUT68180.1 MAG: hypothetical protein CBB75_00250 [bacterium TMED15]
MPNLRFISASPYQDDVLSLPVHDLSVSIPFYEKFMKFQVIRRETKPYQLAILSRDEVKIGLAENGGDPEQEGVYFTVNSVKQAFDFFSSNGLENLDDSSLSTSINEDGMFFIVAPDRLCYCFGED